MSVRVLLADNQPLIRAGFRMLLEEQPGIAVVGEAADGAGAARLTRQMRPDVVLMDVRMPGTDGIETTRRIVAENPRIQGARAHRLRPRRVRLHRAALRRQRLPA